MIQKASESLAKASKTSMQTKNSNDPSAYHVNASHIGARLLEIISSAMYGDARDVLREYIQNSVDAGSPDVEVTIASNSIRIRDSGSGMTTSGLDDARRVGISTKSGKDQVGFRGIGIYSAYEACEKVRIVSRAALKQRGQAIGVSSSEPSANVLEIDCAGLRDASHSEKAGHALSLVDALEKFTRIRAARSDEIPSDRRAGKGGKTTRNSTLPFTEVHLDGVTARFTAHLRDFRKLRDYLVSAVPVDLADTFLFREQVYAVLKKELPSNRFIQLFLESPQEEMDVRQPAPVDILRPVSGWVKNPSGRKLAFVWACIGRKRRKLVPSEAQGLQMRMKGFGIGSRRSLLPWWPKIGAGTTYFWITGDVHVVDQNLIPTADRTTFEDTPARDEFFDVLESWLKKNLHDPLERRRDALKKFELRTDPRSTASKTAWATLSKALAQTAKELHVDPPFTVDELLDELARTKRAADQEEPPQSSEGKDASGRGEDSASQAEGSSENAEEQGDEEDDEDVDDAPDVETLAEVMKATDYHWPGGPEEVADLVDNAVAVIDRENSIAIPLARAFYDGVQKRRQTRR